MSRHRASSLSYSTRREVLVHVASRYQEAAGAQKTLLLDQIVELTGYERKYAIRLLNHVPQRVLSELRTRSENGREISHFPSKKAPLCVHFPHASLVLKGAFPTFSVDFPSYPEF
jgi:hypothetical protein